MAEMRSSHASANWRMSSLWRVPSQHSSTQEERGQDGLENVDRTDRAEDVPSIPPRSLSRLGATSPTSPLGGNTHTNGESQEQKRWSARVPAVDPRHHIYEDDESVDDIELEKQDPEGYKRSRSFDLSSEQEAVLGLVKPQPALRHSRSRRALDTTKATLLSSLPTERLSKAYSKRQLKRESQMISALPPLPTRDSSDSTGRKIPRRVSQIVTSEKRLSRMTPEPDAMLTKDPNLVLWDGPGDPGNPMNWPRRRKWASTFALGFITFCVTFASSVFSPGTTAAAKEFDVSAEVMVLATSLIVLGFAFGPIVWGPLSELYGRKKPLFAGLFAFALMQIPVGAAQNLETIFIFRFLAGFFGCAPLSIVGGALADFWAPVDRGIAVSIFSIATFLGPTMGPLIGGFLTVDPMLGWRWTAWLTLILTCIIGPIGWFVYPESFGPVLLQARAEKLRHATKNWAIHAPADEIEVDMHAIVHKYLAKPFLMLFYEPILLLITIYISFIYGILYLFFETYPISFVDDRHWPLALGGIPFVAVMGGVIMGGVINYRFIKTRYVRILREKGHVPPEERLVPMMVGAIALPVGLFWFAFASSPESSPIAQIIGGAPAGMGIVLIFLQGINYIIDVYMMFSNSAIAANTFVRSLFGAAFPMFAIYMYRNLGVRWAGALLGFIAVALIPVPILFFVYGARIRNMSKFAPVMASAGEPPAMRAPSPAMQEPRTGTPLPDEPAKDGVSEQAMTELTDQKLEV